MITLRADKSTTTSISVSYKLPFAWVRCELNERRPATLYHQIGNQLRWAFSVLAHLVVIGQVIRIAVAVIIDPVCAMQHLMTLHVSLVQRWISNAWPALPGLRLVENLGHHQLTVFLLLVVAEVVLMHHPVRLLGFPLPSVVRVEHQDLLEPSHCSTYEDRAGLPRLVPSRLATVRITVHLPPFPGPSRVRLGRSVKEVADLAVFAHSCIRLKAIILAERHN